MHQMIGVRLLAAASRFTYMSRAFISNMSSPKNILVFGGNGFMGAETVQQIINQSKETNVTIVNRGRSWDWDKLELLEDKVHATITHDRLKPISECKALVKQMDSIHFDAVIDFSGFEPFMVQESLRMFGCRTDLYLYISSDSVYEVCKEKSHSGPTREEDAVRPEDKDEQVRLAEADDYGNEKLQCEECIQQYRKENKNCCNFVILRLADVVGPKDGTDRWWQYQTWLKLAIQTNTRVQLPSAYKHKPLSFVYVRDVSNLIAKIVVEMGPDELKNISNHPFNLACKEITTLDQLVGDIHKVLSARRSSLDVIFDYSDSESVQQIYPSVERGCIDISKAIALLGWKPTPWEEVVRETAEFYENICSTSSQNAGRFVTERQSLYKSLKSDLSYFYSKKQLRILKDILALN